MYIAYKCKFLDYGMPSLNIYLRKISLSRRLSVALVLLRVFYVQSIPSLSMNAYLSWLLDMERVWMEWGRENRSNVQSIPSLSMNVYLSWLLDMERVWMERDRENSGNSLKADT